MPDGQKQGVREQARHLALIAMQVRALGDVELVLLSEDGVAPAPIKLSDELWLIASQLDWDEAMAVSNAAVGGEDA